MSKPGKSTPRQNRLDRRKFAVNRYKYARARTPAYEISDDVYVVVLPYNPVAVPVTESDNVSSTSRK